MRKILALVTLLFTLMVFMTFFITVTADPTGTSVDIIEESSVVPAIGSVSPISTLVNPTTSIIKPLEFAGSYVVPTAPIMPWQYILMTFTITFLIIMTYAAFSLRRHGHRFSRIPFLSTIVVVGLLTASIGQVCAEDMTVSFWDVSSSVPYPQLLYPTIVRESVDSLGRVWFGSALWGASRIGCLNPSTNELSTWWVPEASSHPTTVSVDRYDKVWYTDCELHRIGRFDPSTNFFTVWPIPGVGCYSSDVGGYGYLNLGYAEYSALPLVSIDSQGNAYFPEYYANMIGCIDPETNQLTEWPIPTGNSKPCYTMVDSNDNVWFAEFSGNKIGRLDPSVNEITEWTLPTADSGPSGLYVTVGQVYFAEINNGKIGRLNPNTDQLTQWSITGMGLTYPWGLFVDSNGAAWFVASYIFKEMYHSDTLVRLGADNILTFWTFPAATSRAVPYYQYEALGVAVDIRVNVGDVYVATWRYDTYAFSYWQFIIYRFHTTP